MCGSVWAVSNGRRYTFIVTGTEAPNLPALVLSCPDCGYDLGSQLERTRACTCPECGRFVPIAESREVIHRRLSWRTWVFAGVPWIACLATVGACSPGRVRDDVAMGFAVGNIPVAAVLSFVAGLYGARRDVKGTAACAFSLGARAAGVWAAVFVPIDLLWIVALRGANC